MSTYWKRVRYDENQSNPPWILKEKPGCGLAAYATRDFQPGDQICVEFPVVWIHGHHPFTPEQVKEIEEKVEALSEEDRHAFYDMANVFSVDEYPSAVGIFMTNCFDMTDSIYGTCCAMYLALARLNHSCIPNAQQTHLPETTEEVLYASRYIACGEEINDCYIDLRQPREARQASLLEYYRFHCQCAGCTFSHLPLTTTTTTKGVEEIGILEAQRVQRDDDLRQSASDLIDELTDIISQDDLPKALTKAQAMAKTLAKADSVFWSIRYLPELYLSIYEIAHTLDQRGLARKYLEKAYRLNVLLQGERSVDSLRTAGLLERLADRSNNVRNSSSSGSGNNGKSVDTGRSKK